MIWNLLRKNISPYQIGGYGLAAFIGLTIVLTALQFYADVQTAWDDEDSKGFVSHRYTIVSKPVTLFSSLGVETPSFTPGEIEAIAEQPWAGEVAPFQASDFGVSATFDVAGQTISSAFFFESLPNRVLDVDTTAWTFDPQFPTIPVVVSKDYLALYNFGFAATRRMPQISESIVSKIPIMITLSGNGRRETYPAKIVGFSSRLNTIAVPTDFMDWARNRYSNPDRIEQPSRLVVEVTDPTNPAAHEYLANRGYVISGSNADMVNQSYFLKLLTTIVMAVGIVITCLAFAILLLSLYLLIQKNAATLQRLMLLGYSPREIAIYYWKFVAVINGVVLLCALAALVWFDSLWSEPMAVIGVSGASVWPTLITGIVVMLIISAIDIIIIYRNIRSRF